MAALERARARRSRRARRRRAGRQVLARVRGQRQGGRARPPPAEPLRRAVRLAGADRRPTISTTGRSARRCSPRRRRGGSRARRAGTTRSTQGYLVGEVVRRVSGASVGTFFAKEIAGPLGADFYIGTPADADERVAHVIPPVGDLGTGALDPDSILAGRSPTRCSTPRCRSTDPVAPGRDPRCRRPRQRPLRGDGAVRGEPRRRGQRRPPAVAGRRSTGSSRSRPTARTSILPAVLKLGIGYGLTCPELPIGPNPRTCFWGGWGGSLAINDVDARLTFSYVMNRMGEGTTGDIRGGSLLMAVYWPLASCHHRSGASPATSPAQPPRSRGGAVSRARRWFASRCRRACRSRRRRGRRRSS